MQEGVDRGVGDRAYYERWYSSRDSSFYGPLLGQIISYSPPGPILDVGAGAGLFVEYAMRWGLDCEGIDGSDDAVAIGKKRFPGLRLSQHLLSNKLPFGDGTFQIVLMNQVIEHLEPEVAKNAVRECARVLRAGGMVLIKSPSRFNKREAEADPTHIQMYAPSELRNLVSEAGFQRIVSVDSGLPLLGKSRAAQLVMSLLVRATRWDCLSATANLRAYKA